MNIDEFGTNLTDTRLPLKKSMQSTKLSPFYQCLASVSILPPLVTTTVHPRKPLYQQYFFESYLTLANTQLSTVINSQFQHKTNPFLPKEGVRRLVSVRCQLTV